MCTKILLRALLIMTKLLIITKLRGPVKLLCGGICFLSCVQRHIRPISSVMQDRSDADFLQERKFTVAIEGNIASGKTTLLQYLSKFEDVLIYQEPVDRWRNVEGYNLLGLMYNDPSRWSLAFQTYVQLTMIDLHKRKLPSGKRVKLMERSLFSAKYCFVENLFLSGRMTEVENVILTEWFEWLVAHENPRLDLIVYLRASPEVSWKRIQKRHRPEEATIPLLYLKHLHDLHEDWLIKRNRFSVPCPVLVIDANCELNEMEHLFEKHSEEILCSNGRSPQSSSDVSADALVR